LGDVRHILELENFMNYMKQDLFDQCSLTVAMAGFRGINMTNIAIELAESYGKSYDDIELAKQFIEAAASLMKAVPSFFEAEKSDAQLAGICKTLSDTISKFNLNGTRRRRRFLNGAFFNKEKLEIKFKPDICLSNAFIYHILIIKGVIDIRKI
jgi:hypothetical protein